MPTKEQLKDWVTMALAATVLGCVAVLVLVAEYGQ